MREGYELFTETKGNSLIKQNEKVFITFGRFQPPTKGHQVLFNEVSRLATENNADAFIFVIDCGGGSCIENPLPMSVRINVLKKMYASTNLKVIGLDHKHGVDIDIVMVELIERLHYLPQNITIVEGSDRVEDFRNMISKLYYAKEEKINIAERALQELKSKKELYNGNIVILQAGENRKEGENANGSPASISGTKIRQAALNGNKELFNQGVMIGDMTPADALLLMNEIRKLPPNNLPPLQGGSRKMQRGRMRYPTKKTRKSN
jgi:nicotinic acid mononucleotide adenylyltransferase